MDSFSDECRAWRQTGDAALALIRSSDADLSVIFNSIPGEATERPCNTIDCVYKHVVGSLLIGYDTLNNSYFPAYTRYQERHWIVPMEEQ